MEALAELLSACRASDTDKVTERKKQMEKLKLLLNKGYIIKALDRNSDIKASDSKGTQKLFAWDNLFKVVRNLVWKESEALQKAKDSQSTTAKKKKQEIGTLLKLVVRLADKRGPRLKGTDVVNHVINVLKDDFTLAAFGVDHTSILLKDILSTRKYWCELPQKTWQELLLLYCQLLMESPATLDRSVIARVIHTVIQGCVQQCDIRARRVLRMLQDYFTKVKQEKSISVLEYMVSTTNILCQAIAADSRMQVCRLGEDVFVQLLFLWNARPSDKLKDELVTFYQLQLCVHHPCGAKTPAQGALAVDWDLWKSHLRKLYEAIYSDLQDLRTRSMFTSSGKEHTQSTLRTGYVSLAANLCHQLFTEGCAAIEVTQTSFLVSQLGSASKRRRLESGWGILRDAITTQGPVLAVIPWLQLLTSMLQSYPSSLPEAELHPFLDTLQQLYAEAKRSEVIRWLSQSLGSLVRAHRCLAGTIMEFTVEICQPLWSKVWLTTLRMISLHCVEAQAFSLLQAILEAKLLTPDEDFWGLFVPNMCRCSQPALEFLGTCLRLHDLPERYRPKSLLVSVTEDALAGCKHPLRLQLLDWLLPSQESDLEEGQIKVTTWEGIDLDLLAETLVTLTLRDTRCSRRTASSDSNCDILEEMQQLYLLSSFDVKKHEVHTSPALASETRLIRAETSHLSSVQLHLVELLVRDCKQLMDITQPEVAAVEGISGQCCLMVKVLHQLVNHGNLTMDTVKKCQLYDTVKALMKRLASSLGEVGKKDGMASLVKALRHLHVMYRWQESGSGSSSLCHQMAQLCRSLTPPRLMEQLVEIAYDKPKLGRKSTSLSSNGSSRSRVKGHSTSATFDLDLDLDFDGPSTSDKPGVDNGFDDDFDSGNADSQESEGPAPGGTTGSESLMSQALLTEHDLWRLLVADILCCYCHHNDVCPNNNNSAGDGGGSHGDTQLVGRKLMGLLDSDSTGWDPSRPADFHMLKHIVEGLSVTNHHMSDDEVDSMLEAIRAVCKDQRRDQAVCATVLDLVAHLVPQLSGEVDDLLSASRRDARDIALHLFGVFWKLALDHQYVYKTRVAVQSCMQTFVQVDPESDWAYWRPRNMDDEDGGGDSVQTLRQEFPRLLEDKHHGIRLRTAHTLTSLFVKDIGGHPESPSEGHRKPFPSLHQDANFESIYTLLQAVMKLEGRHSEDEQKDEVCNRTSTVLHTLAAIARVSPWCEKKAVFAICQMTKEHTFDLSLVHKVLEQLAGDQGYQAVQEYMLTHLPYVLHHWLQSYTITAFPHQLLDYKLQNDFYRAQLEVVVPLLVMSRHLEPVQALGAALQTDWRRLVEQTLPKSLVHILPLFAASKTPELASDWQIQRDVSHATVCYDLLTSVVQQETIEQAIVTHLEEIVVDILMTLHEKPAADSWTCSGPEPNPPSFNRRTIIATLDYLTRGHAVKANSLVSLLAKTQDGIQRVLLAVSVRLWRARRVQERCRVLLMYRLLVQLLLQEFQQQLGGSWAFVLRDVLYTLLNVVKSVPRDRMSWPGADKELVLGACELLHELVRVAVESCPTELGRFLSAVVCTLVPCVEVTGDVGKQCQTVVNLLIVENAGSLKASIPHLDPLPDTPAFTAARKIYQKLKHSSGTFSLEQEVEYFLEAGRHQNAAAGDRYEGLRYLRQQLNRQQNSNQLSALAGQCELEQSDSLLVRLTYDLIQLAKSTNQQVAQEAGRCLGVLGPVDLSVIALKGRPHNEALKVALLCYKEDSGMQKYCHIYHMLDEYLVDDSIDTVIAAGSVLKKTLATKTGAAFYANYKGRVADHLFQYLHPFKAARRKVVTLPEQDDSDQHFRDVVDCAAIWCPPHQDHGQWVRHLVCQLIGSGAVHDEVLRLLAPICKVKSVFSETILPYLVHDILVGGRDVHRQILSQQFTQFFSKHCGLVTAAASSRPTTPLPRQGSAEDACICSNQQSVRTMLSVIQYLRLQDLPTTGRQENTVWDNNFWLELDYLQVAKAALNCSAYFTTLLYSEIWCSLQKDRPSSSSSHSAADSQLSQGSQLAVLSALETANGISVQDLMLQAYRAIGDPDGVYGCGAGRLADTTSRIRTYEHENDWNKALGSCDLQMTQQPVAPSTQLRLLHALQKFGSTHILDTYLHGLATKCPPGGSTAELQEFQYEAAWRRGQWDLDTPARLDESCGYQQAMYTGMCSLRDSDLHTATAALTLARSCTLGELGSCSLESVRSLYPMLSHLQCLSQVEDVMEMGQRKEGVAGLLQKWGRQDGVLNNEFEFVEPVIAQRCVLLRQLSDRLPHRTVTTGLAQMLQKTAKMAREAGRHQVAEGAVHSLQQLSRESEDAAGWAWRMEEAHVFWSRGEQETAKHLMKVLINKLNQLREDDTEAATLYPRCLGIYGDWLAETRSESPSVIMEQYLSKAVSLLEARSSEDEAALDAFLSLGRYADVQYQNTVSYMLSSTFRSKEEMIRKARDDADTLKRIGDKNSRYLRTLEKQRAIDEEELRSLREVKGQFLSCAIQHYLKCLQCGDKHDLRVFRLTSLWFDNNSDKDVNACIEEALSRIPSHKFLPLMYQLAARMSHAQLTAGDQFQTTLNHLLERTALDHPHHSLSIILALAHANKDDEVGNSRASKKASGRLSRSSTQDSQQDDTPEDRVLAAKMMVERLRTTHRQAIISDLEKLSLAYIQLANWSVDKYKSEKNAINFPAGLQLTQLKNLKNVAVPTLETKVDPSGGYRDIVHITGFQPTFKLAGGVNLPKIISCVGSDGVTRRQLVKGKDDLRQDAVMQQVFEMVNALLRKDGQTRKRRLHIRTYRVIPLSQRSGLLEWCEGTVPMGEYLIGTQTGAHLRYRPQDWKALDCRKEMNAAHNEGSSKAKLHSYLRVCRHFQPVFRHFFLERFPDPAEWYEKRLSYTRSVATNSIVGYILGLGDRHVQNILIDTQSAELVHIDLGVAFEQGRILPTPETVPFRLTRDVVDGMGIAGVEGVFRRCCEKTMEVMHQHQEALLTILQVLLYDPLYAWTISPQKAFALQHNRDPNITDAPDDVLDMDNTRSGANESVENVNKVAERVLLRLQQKLQGVEEGVHISVTGQVHHLIQEALDPANLCRLFPGWQPYI